MREARLAHDGNAPRALARVDQRRNDAALLRAKRSAMIE